MRLSDFIPEARTRAKLARRAGVALVLLLAVGFPGTDRASAQVPVLTPFEEFGFDIGDDYQLVNYTQLAAYWQKLAAESDRMTLRVIGETAEGRPIYMAIITSPENHRNIDRYREISRRLALAGDLSEVEARALAAEGRSVVWIDGGLHATETLGAQQLIELVYQMVSRTDPETLRFLDDTILLAVCSNPDGLELVADWYMREEDASRRSLDGIPRLYQKYAGHDNNRDFYMSSQPETEAINRVLYREWFPQIVYNHHQSGPAGTVLFAPPFRDPFNFNFDPLIVTSLDQVAAAMHSRFLAEDKPGATMRSGGAYSTWWNGGLRTSPYFHNMIGILTETIGSPTPSSIPAVPGLMVPSGDYPAPVEPGLWHFAQSVEYSMTANRAVLDFASRYRDTLLYDVWRMGLNSIERGQRDHWTLTPDDLAEAERAAGSSDPAGVVRALGDPERRDPRGYVIPSDQPDFLTATRFVNALIKNGVRVHRATASFDIGDASYPSGSYVVRTAQAFRPQVLDMFEPQDYPDDFAFPGAPPTPPYDTTGWTLAFQMGIRFDRIFEGFDGPFEAVGDVLPMPLGNIDSSGNPPGFFLSHAVNDAFIAVNRLLAEGQDVFWLEEMVSDRGRSYPAGTIYIRASEETPALLEGLALSGLDFDRASVEPRARASRLIQPRIGLWDEYGGSESSGWTRFVLEGFGFPYEIVYAPRLDAGELEADFDVLIFPDGGIPSRNRRSRASAGPDGELGEEFEARLGAVSIADTVPRIERFLKDGGTVLSVGSSTALARHLGLDIGDAATLPGADGTPRRLPSGEYYIPGSVLGVEVDVSHPLAYGSPGRVDVFFDQSPAFRLGAEAVSAGVTPVAWFGADPLRSGWAWGEEILEGAAAIVDAPIGDGRLLLYGPEITFRAQSHGTFRFLFNGIYYPTAEPVVLGN